MSSLSRGTWIEIHLPSFDWWAPAVVPLTRDVDWNWISLLQNVRVSRRPSHEGRGLKLDNDTLAAGGAASSLSRGTWIEIFVFLPSGGRSCVVPLTRDVDWNICKRLVHHLCLPSSLSRGTWIEITNHDIRQHSIGSRPSHEGRGLKYCIHRLWGYGLESSLSRGTWIEIVFNCWSTKSSAVVPLTRDVDWNSVVPDWCFWPKRRPSHEGRGLKLYKSTLLLGVLCRPSHEGRGLKFFFNLSASRRRRSSLSRGTWIEMRSRAQLAITKMVVPLTRDVDWNFTSAIFSS